METRPQIVLSVDDNDVDGALLERAFKRTNAPSRLFRVSEGPQAMCYLLGEGIYHDRASYPLPDLVLLDLAMPKMSGMEVLKWIRDQQELKKTKVLIFTSSEKPDDQKSASSAGADGFLLKPTRFDDLKKLVTNLHDEWLSLKQKKPKSLVRKVKNPEAEGIVGDTTPTLDMESKGRNQMPADLSRRASMELSEPSEVEDDIAPRMAASANN